MQERAIYAREMFIHSPELSEICDDGLVWMYNEEDELWYSIAGNYSQFSPEEKRLKEELKSVEYYNRMKTAEEMAETIYQSIIYQSKIRQEVLYRDQYTCQICQKVGDSSLHIHHILKRREGGTDHLDNLLTVCNKCHKSADSKLYDPDWK